MVAFPLARGTSLSSESDSTFGFTLDVLRRLLCEMKSQRRETIHKTNAQTSGLSSSSEDDISSLYVLPFGKLVRDFRFPFVTPFVVCGVSTSISVMGPDRTEIAGLVSPFDGSSLSSWSSTFFGMVAEDIAAQLECKRSSQWWRSNVRNRDQWHRGVLGVGCRRTRTVGRPNWPLGVTYLRSLSP